MIGLKEIKQTKERLDHIYDDLIMAIDEFIDNPTRANRKKVIIKSKSFSSVKIKLIHRIQDFWCKGE